MPTPSSMLLTTADRQIERFTSTADPRESLEDSLYEAILFHETGVLPDIFAFISTPIRDAQITPGATHLESAFAAGLVVPAFRSGCTSFGQSLDRIVEQGILGIQPATRLTATRFDECLGKVKNLNFKTWPANLSRKYGDKYIEGLRQVTGDSGHLSAPQLESNLHLTSNFIRNRGVIQQTQEAMLDGELRRGEVYNILLRELEKSVPTGKTQVHDSYADLIEHAACEQDVSLKVATRNLVVLANSVYQFNMADAFASRNFAPGRLFSAESLPALCIALNCSRGITPSETAATNADSETLEFEVKLPNVKQLRAVDWKELIAIRTDVGTGYFAALKHWQEYPQEFERALRVYAEALTSRVKVKAPPMTVELTRFAESEREGVASVARQAIAMATDGAMGDKILGLAGVASSILLGWKYERSKTIAFARSPTASIVV